MTTKFTPGPWNFNGEDHVVSATGDICEISNHSLTAQGRSYTEALANFKTERQANARLIAAAPELLRLVEDYQEMICETWCDTDDKEVPHTEECIECQAAIAKSKGEA